MGKVLAWFIVIHMNAYVVYLAARGQKDQKGTVQIKKPFIKSSIHRQHTRTMNKRTLNCVMQEIFKDITIRSPDLK